MYLVIDRTERMVVCVWRLEGPLPFCVIGVIGVVVLLRENLIDVRREESVQRMVHRRPRWLIKRYRADLLGLRIKWYCRWAT